MTEDQAIRKMVAPGQHRPGKWKGGVIQIWVTRACDNACFGCTQGSNLGGKPGMISVEQFEQAVMSLKGYFGVVGVFGGNPCLAASTKVYTNVGIHPVEELEGKKFKVRNIDGVLCDAICFHSGKKPLYKITLRGGHSIYATAEHEWPALRLMYLGNTKNKNLPGYNPRKQIFPLGKVRTTQLIPGMYLPIVKHNSLDYGHLGSIEDGFLAGWLLGDGWISKKEKRDDKRGRQQNNRYHKIRSIGLIVNETDHLSGITNRLTTVLRELGTSALWRIVNKCQELTASHSGIDDWLDYFGITSKKDGLPLSTWTTATEEFRRGLIDGLFSSDGNVEFTKDRGYARIHLTSAHEKLIRDVSALLGFYGIKTSIKRRETTGKFPSRKDYGRTYISFDLSIDDTESVRHFTRLFRLTHTEKQKRLDDAYKIERQKDVESTNIEIISVELTDRVEDVWDVSVDDNTHTFQLPHCITGNCMHPKFPELCEVLRKHVPYEQRGLWCNNPISEENGRAMRHTFNPMFSNLNCHLSREAYNNFKRWWPESMPFGLDKDSRHSPVHLAMRDVIEDEDKRWDLIANCDINQHWSAMIGVFRGQLRAWFCEVAGAQSMLHQDDLDYPDTGYSIDDPFLKANGVQWWQLGMRHFENQVNKHCHECGVPLRGYGELAMAREGTEQTSKTHEGIFKPKRDTHKVEIVTELQQLGTKRVGRVIDYVKNASS